MKDTEARAKKVRTEIEEFNTFFVELLEECVFGGFINKLRERCKNSKKSSSDPILLKLCGSLTDVRLMLEIACEKLELELMYTDENKTPLNLLNDVLELENICLVHVQDNASLKYLNCLLETFYSSERPVFCVITIRSNDSSVIRLDPNLAATVSTETFIFDNPQPLFKQVLTGLVVDYTLKRGLFLSGELLKRLKDSFLLEKQSYLELKNIVGMSIAKSGMRCRRYKNSDTRKGTLLPVFKKYWIVLNVFKLYWNQLSPKKDILDLHLEIQLGEYERLFESAKAGWKNVGKDGWINFVEDVIKLVKEFKNEDDYQDESSELLRTLKEFKELIKTSEIVTMSDAIKKNLNLSPSRRKLPTTNSQSTDKIFTSLNAVLCDLKPITDYSIQLAQPVHFKSQ